MTPTELALRYYETVKTRDLDLFEAIFAENASMIYPDGKEAVGRASIREHQAPVYASPLPPTPEAQSIIAGEDKAAVEMVARLADGRAFHMSHFFYFDADGLIERLRIYRRG